MTGEEEQLLREYLAAHGEIDGQDDGIGFDNWYADRDDAPTGELEYKHVLGLANVWRDRYVEGYRQGYNAGYSSGVQKLLDDEVVTLPDVHVEDCAGPGCGATCTCWCHAGEGRP